MGIVSAYSVIFIVALFGNSMALYVVTKKLTTRRVTDLLITNLAIADLILTLTIMPYSVVYMFMEANLWFGGPVGNITCKGIFYALPVSVAASVTTMMVISFERFCALYFPLKQAAFHKQKLLTLIIWLISLTLMIPNLLVFQVSGEGGKYYCYQFWPWSNDLQETFFFLKIFHVVMFVVLYLVPLLIIAVTSFLIASRLWKFRSPGSVTNGNRSTVEISRRKVVKLLVVVVVVFALCWFPTYVNHYFIYFQPNVWPQIPIIVRHLFFWISHANSAINPFLYFALIRRFRDAFMETISDVYFVAVDTITECISSK